MIRVENAVNAMGKVKLRVIAAELCSRARKGLTIDWILRERAQATIRAPAIPPE